ncbi:MAG: hypothetical protein DMF63_16060 [Acidobacteria bacterium]|nr:MAG: hypothetical protein DMF63_16060 [Acidobacteriota bacterium]
MKEVVGDRWSVVSACGRLFCLLLIATCLLLSCSVPNLEEPDCREARDVVREFYSFHFGNDMHPSADNIRLREKYLTGRLKDYLLAVPTKELDYFTATSDLPKAFRVGECKIITPGQSVNFDVLLFWKDDTRSEQRHISIAMKKENDKWLIDAVD